ncbi:hypothetical protein O0L34_g12272 [Tuta absoluta]|nr:hypothetical protein O0L34_g12272 [Tuta absoluta]
MTYQEQVFTSDGENEILSRIEEEVHPSLATECFEASQEVTEENKISDPANSQTSTSGHTSSNKTPTPQTATNTSVMITPKKTTVRRLSIDQILKKSSETAPVKNPIMIAKLTDRINDQSIESLLGKLLLAIPEPPEYINTSYTSPRQETGDLIHDLASLCEPENINVVKFHVLSAWLTTLLPALIVKYLSIIYPEKIKKLQNASLIKWELRLPDRKTVHMEIPRGEL